MMELVRKDQGIPDNNYEVLSGNTREPRYTRKQILVGLITTTLIAVVFTAVALIWGTFSAQDAVENSADFPILQWEGDCPAGDEKECPESFRGQPPPLLLISLDGFRNDYLERGRTPTLQRLARCGVRARFLNPVYPSKTFPNHFTQVTGLYPSSHGIIDNSMFDPESGRTFKLGDPESSDPFWWQTEPIWVTAEKQGKRTATFFWPGSDVRINETFPTFYRNYSTHVPFESRVDQVIDWLDLPPRLRPRFLTLYFHEPDQAAHEHGTHSIEVNAALTRVDKTVERLFSGLQTRNLTHCINIFIGSDHGMADLDCKRVLDLRNYINVSDVHANVGVFARLLPKEDRNTTEEKLLSALKCRHEHLRVYRREELPVRMHYSGHPRIEPLILDTDSGWTIFKSDFSSGNKDCTGGAHGYDNLFPDMKAMFMAIGPSMKRNITVEPFLNVELYELMCELIDINPNPNNGTRGSLHHLLRAPRRPVLPRNPTPETLTTAEVPKDAAEYARRVEMTRCPCAQSRQQVDVADGHEERHLPFGIPSSGAPSQDILLRNHDYVLAYSSAQRMPKWAAFTLSAQQAGNATRVLTDMCWTGDARVSANQSAGCADYEALREQGLLQRPLYAPVFSEASERDEASYVTNSVPMSVEYATAIEGEIWRWLQTEVAASSHLHVVTGPAFATQHRIDTGNSLSVPSHLFVIAARCSQDVDAISKCPPFLLQVDSFLLPNQPYPDNCESATRVMKKNVARVVDIEGVTGLTFFVGLPPYDALRLRTALPSTRSF